MIREKQLEINLMKQRWNPKQWSYGGSFQGLFELPTFKMGTQDWTINKIEEKGL